MVNERLKLQLPLGLYDDPSNQQQADFSYDLYNSNLAIFGSALSGKTTMLKTLLLRIHQMSRKLPQGKQTQPLDEQIYILDFGNALQKYEKLPCVSACFSGMIDENVRRIFKIIEDIYNHNLLLRQREEEITVHTTFIIDGLDVFMEEERYNRYQDFLIRIARDGLSSGVSVISTAAQFSGKILKLRASMGCVIAFDLPADVYSSLYNHKVSKPIQKPGRGVVNIGSSVYEFQAYLPYNIYDKNIIEEDVLLDVVDAYFFRNRYQPDNVDENLLSDYRKKISDRKLKKLPEAKKFTVDSLGDFATSVDDKKSGNKLCIPVGMDFYSFKKIDLEVSNINTIALYGSHINAKFRLLELLLGGLIDSNSGWKNILFWDDGNATLLRFLVANKIISKDNISVTAGAKQEVQIKSASNKEEFIRELSKFVDLLPILNGTSFNRYLSEKKDRYDNTLPLIILIQSKEYFLSSRIGSISTLDLFSDILMYSNFKRKLLFVFTNIPMLNSIDNKAFQRPLTHAFLLDDIVPFVSGNGSDTVFASYSIKELNEMFGLCEDSDGFYMNVETFDLHKVRFLQALKNKEV